MKGSIGASHVASRLVCGLLRRQSLHQQPPDFGNRLTRVQVLRAGLRTVENRVTAIEPKRIFDFVKPFAGCLVAAVQERLDQIQESFPLYLCHTNLKLRSEEATSELQSRHYI